MVDDFIKIIDAIKVYGIVPAIVAIVILVLLSLVGFFAAKKTTAKLVASASSTSTPTKKKVGWLTRWAQKRMKVAEEILEDHGILEPMVFKDMLLRNRMLDFLENAANWEDNDPPARIVIFSYHNGGHFIGGDMMSKMSLRVQVQNKNAFLGEMEGDNVVRGLYRIDFPLLYEQLLHQGHFYISNIQSIRDEDPKFYSLLSRSGLNAAYVQQLLDNKNTPTGFLLVGYTELPKNERALVEKITVFAGYLASTLNLSVPTLVKMFEAASIKKTDA